MSFTTLKRVIEENSSEKAKNEDICHNNDIIISSNKGLKENGMTYSESLKSFYKDLNENENPKIKQLLESIEENIFDVYKSCLKINCQHLVDAEKSDDLEIKLPKLKVA